MSEFTKKELYDLLNRQGPLWLVGIDLSEANLVGANLYEANLTEANLSGANLTGADLSNASLSGANLTGANLEIASLARANLIGAKYNSMTVWPAHFDPKAAGAFLRE